ncbi:MAG: ABC-F family ATP-binding cassette domain-containing protein [Candidatus Zixiibacteriota bacterium]
MIVISLQGIAKSYPLGDVLRGVDWEIKTGEKIALLGKNGSGKTTLMGILSGRLLPDEGIRTTARGVRIAEISQIPTREAGRKLYDYLLDSRGDIKQLQDAVAELTKAVAANPHDAHLQARLGEAQEQLEHAGGYDFEHQVELVLSGLGFSQSQWSQPLSTFSGGERTRIELARLLLTPADLWLLDEPTNHLDIPAVEWLEGFLADSPVACVLVSHDRALLERFAGRIVEMVEGTLEFYDGNYQYYRTERQARYERRKKAYEMQQAEIKRIEDFIQKNIAGQKTKQAQSRRLALSKLDRLKAPTQDRRSMALGFEAQRSSYREVLKVRDLTLRIADRTLLDSVSFECERGDKIGVIGPNGAGKSTLLLAIIKGNGDYDGHIRLGERVEIAYFDQHLEILSGHSTVIEEIWDEYPHFDAGQLRSYLARFLFTGDDVFKPVSALSGGEKSRLALAKLMLTKANLLIMDEPTNHLDIGAREVLEEALAAFEGTAIVVSHDRKFLDHFATKILYVADQNVSLSLGNYSDWAYRQSVAQAESMPVEQKKDKSSQAAQEWQRRKALRAEARRIERRRKELEDNIAKLERDVQEIETQLADESLAREWEKLAELTERRSVLYDQLALLYDDLDAVPDCPTD